MSQTSHRFNLPYIMPSQAQKHVTHNEAIRVLDTLIHASVKSRTLTAPPQDPAGGDMYLVPEAAEGGFAGHTHALAAYIDEAWMFYPPHQGLIVNIEDEGLCIIWRGAGWDLLGNSGGDIDITALSFDTFGINAAADAFNRLVLKSDASLFDHNGTGHQLKINKAGESDTASIVFQNGYSGRAELGLAGEDDFSFKVTADGQNWTQAMRINGSDGAVSFPASRELSRNVLFNMFGDGGRMGGTPEPLKVLLNNGFEAPGYIRAFNGAVLSEGPKFIFDSNNFGGARGTMPVHLEALAALMKPGAAASILRYMSEFFTLSVTAGEGVGGAITVSGIDAYLALISFRIIVPDNATLSYWVRPSAGHCFITPRSHTRTFIDGVEITSAQALEFEKWSLVTRVVSYPAGTFSGSETSPYRIYLSADGAFDLAAPALFPGHILPDPAAPTGIVGSLLAFL